MAASWEERFRQQNTGDSDYPKILNSGLEALDNEYAVGKKLRYEPNFSEGIEAVLIDKGRTPAFTPATPREVDPTAYRSLLRKA